MTLQATWKGAAEFVAFMRGLARTAPERGVQTVGKVGIKMQDRIKANLQALIYSQPEGRYKRTGRLRNSVHAEHPDLGDHVDDDAALAGDLATNTPTEAAAVTSDGKVGSAVGSWVSYSEVIQEGGDHQPRPRPFITDADVDEAERLLGAQFEKDIAIMLGGSN